MSERVAADVLRATILAGTVPSADTPSPFPPAWSAEAPEPGWFERDFSALAPRQSAESAATSRPARAAAADIPVHAKGVGDLVQAYADGVTDPVAVLGALMRRIAGHPSGRDAVLAMLPGARAMAQDSAVRLREGRGRALEGIPFGIKDIIDVEGAPVTAGSRLTGDRVAARDAVVVARLRAHGAIPLAMLSTTEFASGSAHNPRYGAVRNPWNRERWTGGSSTGSAAMLAARLLPLTLGSDTGGSIRVPSAWCGTTGLKPTRGLVPRTGVIPLSWTLDHVGPMARSADDLARVMPLIAGPDGEDQVAAGVYAAERGRYDLVGLRVGVPGGWFVELQDAAVLHAWDEALRTFEGLGARLVEVDLGDIDGPHRDGYLALMSELASLQQPVLDRIGEFDAGTCARIEQGLTFSATAYLRALRQRPVVLQRVLSALDGVDVLVTPGLGCEAAFLDTMTVEVNGLRYPLQQVIPRNTMFFDYTGLPALMLPSGLGRSGLPVAIQIVGKPFDDALCLCVGGAFQAVTGHHLRAPPDPESSA